MMFRVAIIALIASAASALKDLTPNGEISANSALGMRILSQAKVVQPARQLNDQQEERDVTFIANYSLRYMGCHSLIQVSAGENQNNKNNQQESMLYAEHLARFALCPTSGNCGKCEGGGEYVMNMETFVDAFTEARLTEEEYACETVREECDCENANDDDVCEAACYSTAGLTNCVNEDNGQDFEIQRYLECGQMEGGNNNNGVAYYIGPYCSAKDGHSIHLGIFTDAYCNQLTDATAFTTINGYELPYATTSMVDSECHNCLAVNNNNNNNNNGEEAAAEASESCQDLYNNAARCEVKMDISSKDESGCDFINNILPRLTAASSGSSFKSGKSGKGATAFAVIFGFTTCIFAAYAYFLYRKIKRGSVDLSSQV